MIQSNVVICILTFIGLSVSRIHNISIISDRREIIPLANFGLTKDGFIDVFVKALEIKDTEPAKFGIVVECSQTLPQSQFESHIRVCSNEPMILYDKHPRIIQFEIDTGHNTVNISMPTGSEKWDISKMQFTDLLLNETERAAKEDKVSLTMQKANDDSIYTFHYQISVTTPDEGQYTLYFYRCPTTRQTYASVIDYRFEADIVAKNGESYLSAGEMPLTFLFVCIGCVYFGMGWVWIKVMIYHASNLFKIHYLMAALVCAKFLASILHSIDYYFIGSHGQPEEAWAILWYIIHLVRGLLLFISLALIGMGFAFVKHVLSSNEKLVLMTVVPLQIIANVAYVIIDSSEEAEMNYGTWKKILIFLDLLCCGAIIFPVMWSIRHLQQATERSDNKTTLILSQLKLFRQFYVLVVVYIYITRIALEFMKVVLPFKYIWCKDLIYELATIAFFIVTGWKFRPYVQNPYYALVDEDEDELEMESMIIESDTLRSRHLHNEETEA